MSASDELAVGDRVEAVNFWLDEGLRIWPIFDANGRHTDDNWRVVRVAEQTVQEELMRGTSRECQLAHPDARHGINDNETVPPGTQGTVTRVTSLQVHVKWDNGNGLHFTEKDTYRKV